MSYNYKKAQKINNSVTPLSRGVIDNAKKHNLSLENEKYVTNFNTYLAEEHKQSKNGPITHEGMLEEARKKNASDNKILEGKLADSKSNLYPHRQYTENEDKFSVTPINMISEAYDQKFRDAFSKANKKGDTSFWDDVVNTQLDGDPTKVLVNVPSEHNQLSNNPARFEDLSKLPTDESAIVNRDNFDKKLKVNDFVATASGKKRIKMALSTLHDADKMLFGIYLQANSENRSLSDEELNLVNGINSDKEKILMSLAAGNKEEDIKWPEGDIETEDRETDFFDLNPTQIDESDIDPDYFGLDPQEKNKILEEDMIAQENEAYDQDMDLPGYDNPPSASEFEK